MGSPERVPEGVGSAENWEEKVAVMRSFEELNMLLDQAGKVQGSQKEYAAKDIKDAIEYARSVLRDNGVDAARQATRFITDTFGIRTKVRELLSEEAKDSSPEIGLEN